jgi:hypothetical protein
MCERRKDDVEICGSRNSDVASSGGRKKNKKIKNKK